MDACAKAHSVSSFSDANIGRAGRSVARASGNHRGRREPPRSASPHRTAKESLGKNRTYRASIASHDRSAVAAFSSTSQLQQSARAADDVEALLPSTQFG